MPAAPPGKRDKILVVIAEDQATVLLAALLEMEDAIELTARVLTAELN